MHKPFIKLLSFFFSLLQWLFIVVVALVFFDVLSDGVEPKDAFSKPYYFLLAVSFLLPVSAYVGIKSVINAWWSIRKEKNKFEDRREDDLKKSYVDDVKEKLKAQQLEEALRIDAQKYGAGSHHTVRFSVILKSVVYDNGQLPSLGDLRALTYAAESARAPIWKLRIVISVMLIIGILGTLAGVHVAIVDGDPNRVEWQSVLMSKLQPALIPSSFAVFCTILLIILRGFYRQRVDEYIGRLDRHTVSFYFPAFRPPEKSPIELQRINDSIESFGNHVADMARIITGMENVPEQLENCSREVDAVGETLRDWRVSLVDNSQTPVIYEQILTSAAAETQDAAVFGAALTTHLDKARSSMSQSTALLINEQNQPVQWIVASSPYTEQVNIIKDYVEQTPENPLSLRMEVENQQEKVETIKNRLHALVAMTPSIETSLGACVEQAERSAEASQTTAGLYVNVKNATQTNLSSYEKYRARLDGIYTESGNKIDAKINELVQSIESLKKIRADINKRSHDYEHEAVIYWYEILYAVVVLVLLLVNIILIFN